MSRVKITDDNIRHCRCPQCPVQAESDCSKKLSGQKNIANEVGDIGELYCAKGKATCNDLNTNETCICSTCLVWDENNLGSMYYCLRGNAESNG